jgi:hypothetical protein
MLLKSGKSAEVFDENPLITRTVDGLLFILESQVFNTPRRYETSKFTKLKFQFFEKRAKVRQVKLGRLTLCVVIPWIIYLSPTIVRVMVYGKRYNLGHKIY